MKLGDSVEGFTPPPHPKGISLNGARVTLVPLDASAHAGALFEANGIDRDGVNWTYLPYGPFQTLADYTSWLEQIEGRDDPVFFTIIRASDGKPVGIASYLRINPGEGSIEVGHIHFSPLLQRTPEGTEAMLLMMQWAFESGYRRYEWKCNALNARSRKTAQRLGLSYEGVFRQATISKGRNRDTAWFAAIDKEWPRLKACFEAYLAPANWDQSMAPKQSLSALTKSVLVRVDSMEFSGELAGTGDH